MVDTGRYYIICPSASNLAITYVAEDKPPILTPFEYGNENQRWSIDGNGIIQISIHGFRYCVPGDGELQITDDLERSMRTTWLTQEVGDGYFISFINEAGEMVAIGGPNLQLGQVVPISELGAAMTHPWKFTNGRKLNDQWQEVE